VCVRETLLFVYSFSTGRHCECVCPRVEFVYEYVIILLYSIYVYVQIITPKG